jgi:thiol:disulfide interchange protein
MKKLSIWVMTIVLAAFIQNITAQEAKAPIKIYNPEADAKAEIGKAVDQARAEGKHVFVQVGGNWCGWCILFHGYINENADIKKVLDDNYVYALLNYSTENKNAGLLTQYGNPGRFGYPVFLILDAKGKLIHTQDSGLLEEGKGYNKDKVMTFLKNWTPSAVDPKNIR